jgi:hypothetical protein
MLSLSCKHVQHVKICLPCNFEVNPVTHFGVISLFSYLNLTFICNSFRNKGRKVLKCWKFDEKREITSKWVTGFTSKLHGRQILQCWTCLQFKLNIYKLLEINVKFKLKTCLACQDLLTMQFWSKFHYLFWSYYPFFKKGK